MHSPQVPGLHQCVPWRHLRAVTHSDADRLKKWPDRTLQNKGWTNAPGTGSPQSKGRLEADRLGSSSAEDDLVILVGHWLNMSQQCVLTLMKAKEKTNFPLPEILAAFRRDRNDKTSSHFAGSLLCRLANTGETTHLPSSVHKCSHWSIKWERKLLEYYLLLFFSLLIYDNISSLCVMLSVAFFLLCKSTSSLIQFGNSISYSDYSLRCHRFVWHKVISDKPAD